MQEGGKKKSSVGVILGILGRKGRKWEAGGLGKAEGKKKPPRSRETASEKNVGWIYYHRIKVSTFPVVWRFLTTALWLEGG